jgi:hypothetical protein
VTRDAAAVRTWRLALIARAVEHLDTTPRGELLEQLARTDVRLPRDLRRDPAGLAARLRAVTPTSATAEVFGSYKRAQNMLLAAVGHLEDQHEAVRARLDRSPNPSDQDSRREQELWDAMADLKDVLELCLQPRCRNQSPAVAYCGEHAEPDQESEDH